MENKVDHHVAHPALKERRSLVKGLVAAALAAVVGLVPLIAGLIVFLDPLRRRRKVQWVTLTSLGAVRDDGVPQLFSVIADRQDAWNRHPKEPVGAIYLVRQKAEEVPAAFTATCPHAGCFIGYKPGETEFRCPCHTSKFYFDGTRVGGNKSVAPRDMDHLEVEVVEVGDGIKEVRVRFERFQTGKHKSIPIA